MHELLDAAGATLCDPLLIILLAVMMMPSGGSSYVFSGKTDDVYAARAWLGAQHWFGSRSSSGGLTKLVCV